MHWKSILLRKSENRIKTIQITIIYMKVLRFMVFNATFNNISVILWESHQSYIHLLKLINVSKIVSFINISCRGKKSE